ncbi:hypothetical protein BaRGS_00023621 [Batillaria attramentaria]|uniref:Uncharacterized protein n=1 Tax=Batillaria attramentaria TaxID=370345 RepID=A0ABD0KDX1_9CAEN
MATTSNTPTESEQTTGNQRQETEAPDPPDKPGRHADMFKEEFVDKWFPNLLSETYFIPPIDLTPQMHVQQKFAGQTILIPLDPKKHRDYRRAIEDELVQRRVLKTIRALANKKEDRTRHAANVRDASGREGDATLSDIFSATMTPAAENPAATNGAATSSATTDSAATVQASTSKAASISEAPNSSGTNGASAIPAATNTAATVPIPATTTPAPTNLASSRSAASHGPAANRAAARVHVEEAITYLDVTERDVGQLVEKVLVEQILAKLPKQEREKRAGNIVKKLWDKKAVELRQTTQKAENLLSELFREQEMELVLEEITKAVVDQHVQDWVKLLVKESSTQQAGRITASGRDRAEPGQNDASVLMKEVSQDKGKREQAKSPVDATSSNETEITTDGNLSPKERTEKTEKGREPQEDISHKSEKARALQDSASSEPQKTVAYPLHEKLEAFAKALASQWSEKLLGEAKEKANAKKYQNTQGPAASPLTQAADKQIRENVKKSVQTFVEQLAKEMTMQLYRGLLQDLVKTLEDEVMHVFLQKIATQMSDKLTTKLSGKDDKVSEIILKQLAERLFQQKSDRKTEVLNSLSNEVSSKLPSLKGSLSREAVTSLMEDIVREYVTQLPKKTDVGTHPSEKTAIHPLTDVGRQLTERVVQELSKTVARQLAEEVVRHVAVSVLREASENAVRPLLSTIEREQQKTVDDVINQVTGTVISHVVGIMAEHVVMIAKMENASLREKTKHTHLTEENIRRVLKTVTKTLKGETRELSTDETEQVILELLKWLSQEELEKYDLLCAERIQAEMQRGTQTKKVEDEMSIQLMTQIRERISSTCIRQLSAEDIGNYTQKIVEELSAEQNPLIPDLSRRMIAHLSTHVTDVLIGNGGLKLESVAALSDALFSYLPTVSGDVAKQVVELLSQYGDLDQMRKPRIRKTVILPHELARCLGLKLEDFGNMKEVSSLCLCQDTMTEPEYMRLHRDQNNDPAESLSGDRLKKATDWWYCRLKRGGEDPNMTDDLYRGLVKRFCTPATSVQYYCSTEPRVKLWDTAVEHRQQGAGWLKRDGEHVYVTCVKWDAVAATHLIVSQLRHMVPEAAERVHLLDLRREMRSKAALEETLYKVAVQAGGKLNIIADEAGHSGSLKSLCQVVFLDDNKVKRITTRVRLWAAGVWTEHIPECLHRVNLTDPLRSPLTVVKEVIKAQDIQEGTVPMYTRPACPPPADGMPVDVREHFVALDREKNKWLGTEGHSGEFPDYCQMCGMQLGHRLRQIIGVNDNAVKASGVSYKDMLVLTVGDPYHEKTDVTGTVTKPAMGLVTGLRRMGVPLRVVVEGDEKGVKEVAEMSGDDVVTVAWATTVWGLERNVVAVLGMGEEWKDAMNTRLVAMSRAVSQLIYVKTVKREG